MGNTKCENEVFNVLKRNILDLNFISIKIVIQLLKKISFMQAKAREIHCPYAILQNDVRVQRTEGKVYEIRNL